ncbi:MAG TPA: diphosphomevalonate decarboxylase [Thermoanaerobaculia bacterium]|nr:diphosphomevalonate decarboxylase [Thermoanaerobaculia bacterium]
MSRSARAAGSASPVRRATVTAPANIAFVKYWGARDLARAVPVNPSISMTLARCVSRTSVERLDGAGADEVWLAAGPAEVGAAAAAPIDPGEAFRRRVTAHLGELRRRLGVEGQRYRVTTANSFPAAAGIASSASGFAALAVAVAAVAGRQAAPEELSALARASGSGSASRSVLGGYVEWPAPGSPEDDPRAVQLAPADHWDLRDVIAVVESGAKEVSSLDGHRRAASSPHFARRLELLPERLRRVRRAIAERDVHALGETIEEEAIELHLVAMSSHPPVYYWNPGTVEVLAAVRALRASGVPAWSTMDAGANVHVLCPPEAEEAVAERLGRVAAVERLIRDGVGAGPRVEEVVE